MMVELAQGRAVLVTGGGSGIGGATALKIVQEGAAVVSPIMFQGAARAPSK
jgi:NAD(P)-dependent dehydrogenase (short-subunit alcohol dehydrogenase family)